MTLLSGLRTEGGVIKAGDTAQGEDRGSHFTFRVSDFLKVSLVKASLKASQVRVNPLSSRRTRNVRLDMEM